ncbi:MAG: hypothetical protein LC802_15550 [Acidobacteria bacterium]|nr:hypothetical protein [Acidobacteriota bacterium]
MNVKSIYAETNRGILLDVVVFLLSLILMRWLTKSFVNLARLASSGDTFAEFALGLFFLGMFVLPAAGAVLKRWHFHQRLARLPGHRAGANKRTSDPADNAAVGCFLHPAFYLAVSLCLAVTAVVILGTQVFGEDFHQNGAIFLPLIFGTLVLSILQTVAVYSYFEPPAKTPAREFWRDPRSALLGDACIYLNMIFYQVLWNVAVSSPFGRVTGFEDFAGRVFFLFFVALLVYFPPRIFYLAEDITRPTAWLTIFLANSPVILRVLLGIDLMRIF